MWPSNKAITNNQMELKWKKWPFTWFESGHMTPTANEEQFFWFSVKFTGSKQMCEAGEGLEGGEKGVWTEYQSHIFTLPSFHTYIIPLATFVSVSAVSCAAFKFSIFPFFHKYYSWLLIKSIAAIMLCFPIACFHHFKVISNRNKHSPVVLGFFNVTLV